MRFEVDAPTPLFAVYLGNRAPTTEATIIREALIRGADCRPDYLVIRLPEICRAGRDGGYVIVTFSHFDARPLYCRLIRNT
jgi:hypothetical protein